MKNKSIQVKAKALTVKVFVPRSTKGEKFYKCFQATFTSGTRFTQVIWKAHRKGIQDVVGRNGGNWIFWGVTNSSPDYNWSLGFAQP